MNYKLVEKGETRFIECLPGKNLIQNEQDALNLVTACGENDTNLLMVYASNLPEAFFDLKTGFAGSILLKFSNYYIKIAAILTPELVNQGKFQEWVIETNRGNEFRVFYDRKQGENWLTSV